MGFLRRANKKTGRVGETHPVTSDCTEPLSPQGLWWGAGYITTAWQETLPQEELWSSEEEH